MALTEDQHRSVYVGAYALLGLLLVAGNFVIIPVIVQMLLYTLAILYIACHQSLRMFDRNPETGEQQEVEAVSTKDAMLFPFIGSGALLTLYLVYKFVGKYWVNMLLNAYLTILGIAALGETLRPILEALSPASIREKRWKWQQSIPWPLGDKKDPPWNISFGPMHILAYVLGAGCAGGFLITKHWCLNNLYAIAFSIQAVVLISLGRFRNAFILLFGLFWYDVFWVFGTDVMVSVAMQFEAPAKLLFPVSFDPWKQSLLGLGDIVIPGIFLAMTLRFDAHNQKLQEEASGVKEEKPVPKEKKEGEDEGEKPPKVHYGVACDKSGMNPIVGKRYTKKGENYDLCEAEFNKLSPEEQAKFKCIDGSAIDPADVIQFNLHKPFPKPYYYTTQVAYTLGLLTTGGAMFFFESAQPALLYLVPFTITAFLGCAFAKGQVRPMWDYDEEKLNSEEGGEEGETEATEPKKEK